MYERTTIWPEYVRRHQWPLCRSNRPSVRVLALSPETLNQFAR